MDTPNAILLYDGCCNLCNTSVMFIKKRDRKLAFRFVPLQSEEGVQLLTEKKIPDQDNGTVILIYSDKFYMRSDAALMALRILGRGWQLLYVFIILPRFIRDGIYRLIAKTRYRLFGRSDTCCTP
ncbi:MAG: DCC1-like thiol-disulfide oxidoreductase family protein [Bacteroidales bacterium]